MIACRTWSCRDGAARRLGAALAFALVLASLGACTPRTENWSPAQSPKRNLVSWAEYHHSVAFRARSAELGADQRAALADFLGRNGGGEGVRLFVAAPEAGDPALALRREAAVAGLLRASGRKAELAPALPAEAGEMVRVTVGRYVVTPPNCPDWSKPATGDSGNSVSSNFGCATTANLGLMIADPGALIRGYPAGPGDGEFLARGVQDYREGKTAPLAGGSTAQPGGATSGSNSSGSGN